MEEALSQLEEVALSLLSRATRPDEPDAAKGFKCLRELRRACAMEEEPLFFNALFDRLSAKWRPAPGGAGR